jgi:hypothetical protein
MSFRKYSLRAKKSGVSYVRIFKGSNNSSTSIIRVNKSRRMRWEGNVARMGERRGAYRVLVGKPEGKRPLGRPKRRWENNIKLDLQEVGCSGA